MGATWLHSHTRVWVAQMCGNDAQVMGQAAGKVLRSVRTVAAQHRDTGNYMRNLKTVQVPGERSTGRSVKDRLVVADDPAAYMIEYGYIYKYPNARRVKWVPGLHIMTNGLARVKTID